MTSFLNLNINDAFDNVSHFRFLHNMKKRKVSNKLLKWIKNFLKNRNTTLIIENHMMTKRKISVNISQNSSFFLMLYLFYNANLLKSCENVKLRFNIIEFVNNINILTYNELTEQNCEILKKYEKKSLSERKNTISNSINENTSWFTFRKFLRNITWTLI